MEVLCYFLARSLLVLYSLQTANGQGVSLEHNGNPVPNFGLLTHSDIDTSDDNTSVGGNLVCRTDLTTCCRGVDGVAQGNWYYPTDDVALFASGELPSGQIYRMRRSAQVVQLRRELDSTITANGIYRCEVADQNGVMQNRYVGLYTEGAGVVSISEDPQFSLISEDLEFTLTSTTTGGPPTTAEWTLPGRTVITAGDGFTQTLLNATTATFEHTLTVTGITGMYTFSTTNTRNGAPDTSSITVQAANPPTGLMAVQNDATSILVSWTAPASGGDSRTGYRIFYQTGGGSVQNVTVGATATSHTLTGLQSGATYSISIEAHSNELPSARVGPETVTFRAFEAPTVMTSVLGPTSIRVTFTQPSGTLAAESYDIQYTRVTGAGQILCRNVQDTNTTTDVQSPFNITNLEEFSSYDITVTARVFSAMRATTEQAIMTSPAVPAAAPRDLVSTTVLSTSITVGWNTVVCIERNGVIVNYIVRFGPEGGVQSESTVQSGGIDVAGTYTASGLTPFTNYSFEVAAMNSVDTGPFTATLFVVTDEDEPGPVDSLRSSTLPTSITITWNEPQAPNGVITRYEVQYSPQSDPTNITTVNVALSRTFTLPNLEPGTTFTFQVTAFTRIGRGPSETLTATTAMRLTPDPPVVTLGVVTATTVTLSWSPQSGVSQYEVRYVRAVGSQQHGACRDFIDTGSVTTTENSLTVAGLQEFSTYTVTVFAVNNAGRVPSEEIVITTPEAASAPPRGVEVVNFTDTAITVHWEPLECIDINSQFEITGYAVRYGFASEPETLNEFSSSSSVLTINVLAPGVEYFIEVAAVNSNGETGEYSNRIIQTTSGGGAETATVAAVSVVVVLVVLILAMAVSGVVIAVLVLKHRRAAPPLTQQPPTTEGVVLTTFSNSAKPPVAISTGPNAAYQTVASGGRGQRQGNDGDHAYEYIVPPTQQSHDQPELPHIYEST